MSGSAYAGVLNNIVVEIVVAPQSFMDNQVSSGTFDSYFLLQNGQVVSPGDKSNGDGTFTTNLTVQQAMMLNLSSFQVAVQAYVDNLYSLDVRFNLNAMYTLAVLNGLTNRATYILQLFTWAQSVVAYSAQYAATIQGMNNAQQILNTTWDLTKIVVPNPNISPMVAIGIPN